MTRYRDHDFAVLDDDVEMNEDSPQASLPLDYNDGINGDPPQASFPLDFDDEIMEDLLQDSFPTALTTAIATLNSPSPPFSTHEQTISPSVFTASASLASTANTKQVHTLASLALSALQLPLTQSLLTPPVSTPIVLATGSATPFLNIAGPSNSRNLSSAPCLPSTSSRLPSKFAFKPADINPIPRMKGNSRGCNKRAGKPLLVSSSPYKKELEEQLAIRKTKEQEKEKKKAKKLEKINAKEQKKGRKTKQECKENQETKSTKKKTTQSKKKTSKPKCLASEDNSKKKKMSMSVKKNILVDGSSSDEEEHPTRENLETNSAKEKKIQNKNKTSRPRCLKDEDNYKKKKMSVKKKILDSSSSSEEEEPPLEDSSDSGDNNEDEQCIYCLNRYSNDVAGEKWVQCTKCFRWCHELCAGIDDTDLNFNCGYCIDY